MKKMFYCFGLLFVMNVAYHAHGSELPKFPTTSAGNINSSKVVPSSVTTPNDGLKSTGCSSSTKKEASFTYRNILLQLGLEDEDFRQLWNKICKTSKDTICAKYKQLGLSEFFESDFHNTSETSIGEKIDPGERYSSSQVDALSRLITIQVLINEEPVQSTEQRSPQIISSRVEKSVAKAPTVAGDDNVFNYSELLSILDVKREEFIGLLHEIEAASPQELVKKYEESKFKYDESKRINDHDSAEQIFILDKVQLNSLKIDPSNVCSRVYSNEYVAALYRLVTALRALISDKCHEVQHEKRHSASERQHQQNNSKSRLEEIGENISREGKKV